MHSINNVNGKMTNNNPLIPDVFPSIQVQFANPHLNSSGMHVSYPQSSQSSTDKDNINLNFDFEENSPFQEGDMSKTCQRPDKSFFKEPEELGNLINKENLIHKYLPKQTYIDKMLEVIQKNVLKGTHLLVKIKELQAGYLHSSYFKDLYLYLSQNKLPSSKVAIKRVEALAEKYVLLDSLLFKVSSEKETVVLAVPEAMHRQDYNTVSLKLVYRTSRSH